MTDQTEQPRTLKVFTCVDRRHESRSCHALVEDDKDARLAHRKWHLDQETDREGLRKGIKDRDEEIASLKAEIAGYRRDVAEMDRTVESFHGEVQRVETPTPPPALEIDRDGYTDDEIGNDPEPIEESFTDERFVANATSEDVATPAPQINTASLYPSPAQPADDYAHGTFRG